MFISLQGFSLFFRFPDVQVPARLLLPRFKPLTSCFAQPVGVAVWRLYNKGGHPAHNYSP